MKRVNDRCLQWSMLADQTVRHADPAWWPDMPAELIARAKQSRIGRRMLAEHLASKVAPNLFQLLRPLTADEQRRYTWLIGSARHVIERVTDLGTLSLSPAIRQTVDGDAVSAFKDALTEERYAWALCTPDPWHGAIPDEIQRAANEAIRGSLRSASEFRLLVQGIGLREVAALVREVHAGLQELLRLCFSPNVPTEGLGPWLPNGSVAACLCLNGSNTRARHE